MSVQEALRFIQRVRRDEELRRKIASLAEEPEGDEEALERLARFAAAWGFDFAAEELRQAHEHDWVMRRIHYVGVDPDGRAPTGRRKGVD